MQPIKTIGWSKRPKFSQENYNYLKQKKYNITMGNIINYWIFSRLIPNLNVWTYLLIKNRFRSIYEYLSWLYFCFEHNKSLFIGLGWFLPIEQKLFYHFSEVICVVAIRQMNKDKDPLLIISRKDMHGKMLIKIINVWYTKICNIYIMRLKPS